MLSKIYLLELIEVFTFLYANSSISGRTASCREGTDHNTYNSSSARFYKYEWLSFKFAYITDAINATQPSAVGYGFRRVAHQFLEVRNGSYVFKVQLDARCNHYPVTWALIHILYFIITRLLSLLNVTKGNNSVYPSVKSLTLLI